MLTANSLIYRDCMLVAILCNQNDNFICEKKKIHNWMERANSTSLFL